MSSEEETGDEEISHPMKFGPPWLGVPGPSAVRLAKTTSKPQSKAADSSKKDDRKAMEGVTEISSSQKSEPLPRSKKRKADAELPKLPPSKVVKSEQGGRRIAKVVGEKPTSVSNLILPK